MHFFGNNVLYLIMWVTLKQICHCMVLILGAKINYIFRQWNSPLLKWVSFFLLQKYLISYPQTYWNYKKIKCFLSQHWESISLLMYFIMWKNFYYITKIQINNFITSNIIIHIIYCYIHAFYTLYCCGVMYLLYCCCFIIVTVTVYF